MRSVNLNQEFVYTVDVRDKKTGKFVHHPDTVVARGMNGVALLLKRKPDDVRFVSKVPVS